MLYLEYKLSNQTRDMNPGPCCNYSGITETGMLFNLVVKC